MLYVIRHGQTQQNRAHALQGRSDQPLNEAGVAQARAAGEWLDQHGIRFSHVFSSPLQRAVQTAQIVAPGVRIVIDERLIEMDYGPYEGADLRNPAPEIIEFFSDFVHNPAPEGMEQLDSVVRRTGAFAQEVASLDGNILVSYWSKYVGNCAVYAAEACDGSWGVPAELDMRA